MSRYQAAHEAAQGPGDARPTAMQIIRDNKLEGQLPGIVVVITGVSSGIGVETARALGVAGATLYMTARDLAKARSALADLWEPDRMALFEMDNSSLESVRCAAKAILAKTDKIHILINNAGIMCVPQRQLSIDGHELHFATNHLAHFLLFELLKPALLLAATAAGSSSSSPSGCGRQSRVVNVASSAHRLGSIQPSDNYDFQNGGSYNPWVAYAQSKTANIYMASEIERRYGPFGVHAHSVHPGLIATGIGAYLDAEQIAAIMGDEALQKVVKSPEQGAATTVWAAIASDWEGKGGKYLLDCRVAPPGDDDGDTNSMTTVSWTYNPEEEGRLWRDSLTMVGLSDETEGVASATTPPPAAAAAAAT